MMSTDGESRLAIEISKLNNRFSGPENTEELIASARELLPFTKDDQFKIVSVKGKVNCFKAEINCDLSTIDDIHAFIVKYKLQNDETLRARTPSKPGPKSK